jgi:hypothetical protein
MRRIVVLAVLGLLLVTGGWLVFGGAPPADEGARTVARTPSEEVIRERPGDGSIAGEPPSKPDASKRTASKQDREVMRRRIVEAMQEREHAAAGDGERAPAEEGGGGASAPTRRSRGAEPPEEAEPEPGNLTDRTGNHGYLMKVMNEDLMPLADECYALARETQPELAGMLVIDVEIIGDEDIGGVIETATPGQDNELADPALLECVRESLLSTTLPPPPEGGKDAISLSLRLEPDEG